MDPGRRPHWAGRRALCPQVASLGLGQAVTKRDAERVELGGQFEHLTRIQSGAISARQLAILGLSRETIAGRVGSRVWQRPELGVYVVFSGPLPPTTRMWAAVLRAGSGAALSHRAAAVATGLLDTLPRRVQVAVPVHRQVRGVLNGVEVRRRRHLPDHIHPAQSPPRIRLEHTVLDLADECETERDVVAWVTTAVQQGRTTSERLRSALMTRSRTPWRRFLLSLLADVDAGAHSPLEYHHRLRVHLAHGLPDGQRQRRAAAPGPVWVDVELATYSLVIELDGRVGHEGDGRFRDRRRDNRNAVHGRATLRYGHAEVFGQPCEVAAETALVLRERGWAGEPKLCGSGCPVNADPAPTG